MKICIYLAFILISQAVLAQPVITQDVAPEIGTSYKAYYQNSILDPGTSGPNQNWDYSSISSSLQININVLSPEDSPANEHFPDADFVWNIEEFETFFYYDVNEDSLSQLGGAIGDMDFQDIVTVNSDWEDGLHFPLQYQDQYEYTTAYSQILFGSLMIDGSRVSNILVDGYGTVKTPVATYDEVLRVKIEIEEFGFVTTQYAWMHPSTIIPALLIESSTDPETEPSYYYTDLNIISSSTDEDNDSQLEVHYSNGYISILGEIKRESQIYLHDSAGKSIGININKDYSHEVRITPYDMVKNGIYFISIGDHSELKTYKVFVKE